MVFTPGEHFSLRGVAIYPGAVPPDRQADIVSDIRSVAQTAPLFHPETRRGRKMSVRMTSAGQVGWVSDRRGYRYEALHPSGSDWPEIPDSLLSLWARYSGSDRPPDTCLINYYGEGAKMGLHQDRDEADTDQPVLSLSLGDAALFRVGNVEKGGPTESAWLASGDVAVLAGDARLVHHGIDRIRFGSSTLLPQGGRINVTMRVAT